MLNTSLDRQNLHIFITNSREKKICIVLGVLYTQKCRAKYKRKDGEL